MRTNTLYAGTFGGGIFKSFNGGASWMTINSGLINKAVSALVIDPQNSNIVYAGTQDGVFKSVDGGGSWRAANTGLGSRTIFSLAVDHTTSNTLYVGTADGVSKSLNGGTTWQESNQGKLDGGNGIRAGLELLWLLICRHLWSGRFLRVWMGEPTGLP